MKSICRRQTTSATFASSFVYHDVVVAILILLLVWGGYDSTTSPRTVVTGMTLEGAAKSVIFSKQQRQQQASQVKSSSDTRQKQSSESPESSSSSTQSRLVIFLHGRLESEPGVGNVYPPPRQLYSNFLNRLVDKFPSDDKEGTTTSLLMVEYDELLSKHLSKEPRDLQLGPVSSAILECIRKELVVVGKAGEDDDDDDEQPISRRRRRQQVTLITFSMGAAMGLKLLSNTEWFLSKSVLIENVVFIEPVWRCWLPFVVSNPKVIADIPALAIIGSNDKDTLIDSGRNVKRALQPFLPNVQVVEIDGGNHWYILNEESYNEMIVSPSSSSSKQQQQGVNVLVTEEDDDIPPHDMLQEQLVESISQFLL